MKTIAFTLAALALLLSTARAESPPDRSNVSVILDTDTPECLQVVDGFVENDPFTRFEVHNGCAYAIDLVCPAEGDCLVDDGADPVDLVAVAPGATHALLVPSRGGEIGWRAGADDGRISYRADDGWGECSVGMIGCDASGTGNAPAWLAAVLFGLGLGLRRRRAG